MHGLGGTAKRTWSWERNLDYFWSLCLADEDGLSSWRIFTFGCMSELLHPWRSLSRVAEFGECESAPSVHKSCVPVWPACPQARATLILDDFADNINFKGAGTNINIIDFAKDLLFRMLFFSNGIGDKWTPIDRQPIVFIAHLLDRLDR